MNSTHDLGRTSLLPSLLVSALGVAVIAGWYLRVPILLHLHPSFVPMVYNTALGFVLSGLAVFFLEISRPGLARIFGLFVLLIGVVTLLEILSGLDLQVDELFMRHYVTAKDSTPGRMAPNAALCFVLSGVNLLMLTAPLSSRIKARVNGLLAPVIVALAAIALIGYAFGIEAAYEWGRLNGLAAHAAAGFLVLGLAFFLHREPEMKRDLIPSVGIFLLAVVLSLWQAMDSEAEKSVQHQAEHRVEEFRNTLKTNIANNARAIEQMAARWDMRGGIPRAEWQSDALRIVVDNNHLLLVIFFSDTQAPWVAGDESTANLLTSIPRNLCEITRSTSARLIPHPTLEERMLVQFTPIGKATHASGCLMTITLLSQEILQTSDSIGQMQFPLTILAGNISVYQNPSDGHWQANADMREEGLELHLQMIPTKEQMASSPLPTLVLIAGMALSVMFIVTLYLNKFRIKSILTEAAQQKQAQESETRRNIIEDAPYGIALIDPGKRIELVNSEAEKLFGYSREQLIGQPIELLVPASDLSQGAEAVGIAAQAEPVLDVSGRHRDGRPVAVEVSLAQTGSGSGARTIVAFKDVRERKEAQRRIEAQVNELASINAELNNFVFVASHDLKAPLRGIDQLAAWIAEDMGDHISADTQNHLRLMSNRVRRMAMLLDDLLAYSRVGRTNLEIVSVDTRALVNDIFEISVGKKEIHLKLGDDLPVLRTRKVPLELVFRNLIGNAIKHHDKPNGCISVSARVMADRFEFSIQDDGPGIPKEHQERVFGMFQTLKPRDELEGSGMGLALVRKAVESVGGTVTLISDGQSGCTFRFTWPMEITKEELT